MRRENATKRKMRKIKGFKNKKMRITVSHIRGEMRWDGQAGHGRYMRVTPIVGDVLF